MKKIMFFLVLIFVTLFLFSCNKKTEYIVNIGGTEYIVNYETNTIKDNEFVYEVKFIGNKKNYNITITYPDGNYYYATKGSSGTVFGMSGSIDKKYTDQYILINIFVDNIPRSMTTRTSNTELIFVKIGSIVALVLLGLFLLLFPQIAWYLEVGWKVSDGEPSETYLAINRIIGVICLVIALLVLIFFRTKI